MRVLVAPDKFKGSLTAAEVAAAVAQGLADVHPALQVQCLPVADGGDGTVDAAVAAGFRRVRVPARGPTGWPLTACYAVRGDTAVVELAEASGLHRLPGAPAPLEATSAGTGDVIAAALRAGCRRIVLGVGGSVCTDGGAGMLAVLGARLLDGAGRELPPGGAALSRLAALDLSGLDPRLSEVDIELASDVDNPLFGLNGAAVVYGPQKGASPDDVEVLDEALRHWASHVGPEFAERPGAGAAGEWGSPRWRCSVPGCVRASDCCWSCWASTMPWPVRRWSSPARDHWTGRRCPARPRPASPGRRRTRASRASRSPDAVNCPLRSFRARAFRPLTR